MSSSKGSSSGSSARTWSFAHSSAAHASALFCPSCSSILDLPDADLILRCTVCTFQTRFTGEDAHYEKLSISTKYSTAQLAEDAPVPVPAFTRAKVKEKCPQCANPEMSFYTVRHEASAAHGNDGNAAQTLSLRASVLLCSALLCSTLLCFAHSHASLCALVAFAHAQMQMRSVDEGQTVFFECPKCGHTFSTNT